MPRRSRRATPSPAADPIDFQAITECFPDVVYTLDLDGRFTYLNARAYEVFGYDRAEGDQFIGRPFLSVLAPGATAAAIGAIRHRVEHPRDLQVFRLDARRKDGGVVPLEVHGGPLVREGRVVGRVGVCRVLASTPRDDGERGHMVDVLTLHEDRMRIARGLRDAVAQIVFGVTPERDATDSFVADVKRATRDDLARRLRLDDVDLEILRLVAAGSSNREIGGQVHLSPAAVKDRIRRLMTRLGTRRRAELAAQALRLGVA